MVQYYFAKPVSPVCVSIIYKSARGHATGVSVLGMGKSQRKIVRKIVLGTFLTPMVFNSSLEAALSQ